MNKEYREYLQTDHWKNKRAERLKIDGYKCAICGRNDRELNVHHLNYRSLGKEKANKDLVTLCKPCHTMLHRIKECTVGDYICKDAGLVRKIYELTAVEVWQRDMAAGGDLKVFDSGMGMIGKLVRIIVLIYPEIEKEIYHGSLNVPDRVKEAVRLQRTMRICEMYRLGANANMIADRFGMKTENVYKVLKRHGFNKTAKIK